MFASRIPTALATAACALILVSTGCDDGGSGVASGDRTVDPAALESEAFAIVDSEDAFAAVNDATMDAPMSMRPPLGAGAFQRPPGHPGGPASHLGHVLRSFGLTPEQADAIRDLVRGYRDTIRPALDGIRDANADTVAAANAERDAILAALRAGTMTRIEALRALLELSRETRDAIRSNPLNDPYEEQICVAKRDLFDAIGDVLDAEQRAAWDTWVAGLRGPCFGG